MLAVVSVTSAMVGIPGARGTAKIADADGPEPGITYQVSAAGQRNTLIYWTTDRMGDAATAVTQTQAAPATSAPKGTPSATTFSGSPTTGALFYTTGGKKFYCHGFWTGTSGGPWISGYKAKNGTGTVFGVIGGYELGGDYDWASYSAYFGSATRSLYTHVEAQTAPVIKPTRSPTPTPTNSTASTGRAI
jgi:hypothetical protein